MTNTSISTPSAGERVARELAHEYYKVHCLERDEEDLVKVVAAALAACARESVDQCKSIVLASYTYHVHSQVCWCERCAYVRANVTEMNVLAAALERAAGERAGDLRVKS